jgi:hypothetical protein
MNAAIEEHDADYKTIPEQDCSMGPWPVRDKVNRCARTGRGPMLRYWDKP